MKDIVRLERLRSIATTFRAAIELAPPPALGITFERFPLGACGDTTPLLGTYLIERGEGKFDYVLGERPLTTGEPGTQSHAWLQQSGLVIDITADQFEDCAGMPVIVAPAPTPFHQTFEWNVECVADYRIYDGYSSAMLAIAYRRITEVLAAV